MVTMNATIAWTSRLGPVMACMACMQVSFIRNGEGRVVFDRAFNTASMLQVTMCALASVLAILPCPAEQGFDREM
jgi:hypothetical protein